MDRRSRGSRIRLRNWRVPVRLVALIMIPAVVAGMLAGLRVRDALQEVQVFTRIEHLATLGDGLANLTHELEDERDLTAQYITTPGREHNDTLSKQQEATDRAAGAVRGLLGGIDGSYSPLVRAKVRDLKYRLDFLPGLRKGAGLTNASAYSAIDIFSQLVAALLEFDDLIAQGSPNADVAESTRAFAALARAKDAASQERALALVALLEGRFPTPADRERLQTIRSQQDSQLALFRTTATTAQRQLYDDTVTGPEIGQVESLYQRILIRSGESRTLSVRPLRAADAQTWNRVTKARSDNIRKVEQKIASSIVLDTRNLKDSAWRAVFTDLGVLLVGLLFALWATVIVGRSLVRPLRRLRDDALEVAGSRLPGLVDRLRDPQAAAAGIDVEPVKVNSIDEIGEVARAFDEVHREAVRLAADEAILRGNINAMFVNLSRRSQSLIERQLRLIDDLEQGEQDDKRLASLFQLDHLATRMRRNCENLLVLGGQEQVRRWNQPVPLVDIVRASLSEVEQYDRIGVRVQGEVSVIGPVVNDLIHLVAELVENATVFSPEHTKVTISGHLLSGGGAMLQITDNGVGMTAEELEEANWRLANPPVVDVSVARRMGLFVVGRLAGRHGIRVELRAALSGGITAFALLPARVVAPDENQTLRSRRLDDIAVPESPAGLSARPAAAAVSAFADPPEQPAPGRWDERLAGSDGGGSPAQPPQHVPQPSRPDQQRTGPVVGWHTGPQPSVGRHTGPQPSVGRHTGPQPSVAPHTGPQPVAGRHTGPQPALGRQTGPQTGPQPSMGRTGPQPVVPAESEHVAGPPGGNGMSGPPSWETSESDFSRDNGAPPAEPPKRQERSPIFDAMESEWFQRHTTPASAGEPSSVWTSPADDAWQAAEVVRRPASGGRTSVGLPKRVPGKNRVPGAVPAASQASATPAAPAAAPVPQQVPPQSADTIRNRFASFQQGVHRGRVQARSDDSSRTGETP